MANLIDLTIPIRHGDGRLGKTVVFERTHTFAEYGWQASSFSIFAHYPTHVDAPRHFVEDGMTIDQVPLGKLIGPAALIDLTDHRREGKITGDTLEDRGRHIRAGDICILRTGWSDAAWGTESFWRDGPFLSPDGADWLVKRRVHAVVYDFAEEYSIRDPHARGENYVVHHKILGNDIYNIEYVQNLIKISQSRLTIIALPLKLEGFDGAPARVLAMEGVDLPGQFSVK
jgi:arylformamidase